MYAAMYIHKKYWREYVLNSFLSVTVQMKTTLVVLQDITSKYSVIQTLSHLDLNSRDWQENYYIFS